MALTDPALAQESPLASAELADAEALVREAGWNQTAADWRIFLDFGSVYAVRNSAGRVVATAATLPYGGRFAWISMVLVAGEYRRQGLARRLLRRCVDDLKGAGLVPVLDATPAGRSVYLNLGFVDCWSYQRLACREFNRACVAPAAPEGAMIRPIADADWLALCRYDAAAFGADRSAVLGRLRGRAAAAELVAYHRDRISGFLLGRNGRSATQLGPLVADDDETALALLCQALRDIDGLIYTDLADAKPRVGAWLARSGFVSQRPLTRMIHGSSERFDDPARTFAVAGPELG